MFIMMMAFYYALASMAVQYVMAPDPTNNTGAYDAAAAEAKRNAEKRELKNKRNRAGQLQTVGAGLNGVSDILG
jgi:hypothetical protein